MSLSTIDAPRLQSTGLLPQTSSQTNISISGMREQSLQNTALILKVEEIELRQTKCRAKSFLKLFYNLVFLQIVFSACSEQMN